MVRPSLPEGLASVNCPVYQIPHINYEVIGRLDAGKAISMTGFLQLAIPYASMGME